MSRITREEALDLWAEGSSHHAEPPVGWQVGVRCHPADLTTIVLGARRVADGEVFLYCVPLIDVLRPYTDEEVRAMLMREWGKWGPGGDQVPEVVRLAAGELVVGRFRCR